jgi:2-polyprenyl-6-methoxyphenol hydroxylase-like FAD-dependent oxidoreductase
MGEFDVAIVGGGMVGASLRPGALRELGRSMSLLVEGGRRPKPTAQPSFDERTTAHSAMRTRRIFESTGRVAVDARRAGAAIRTIHVSDARAASASRACVASKRRALRLSVTWCRTA